MRTKLKKFLKNIRTSLRRPKYANKVFCVGFNKTGTSSCGKAFELLGYRNLSFDKSIWRELYKKGRIMEVLNITAKFDSFDDLPWLKEDMIPILDKVFPNSKFVYLERDEESWKKSIYNWSFKEKGVYPDLEHVLNEFRNHRSFVLDYFKDRPNDLLIISIADKDAFMKLANFLGKKTEYRVMPHENKT